MEKAAMIGFVKLRILEPDENNELRGERVQEWKFMSCSHCQKLCQHASCLLIGGTRVNNQPIRSQVSKLTQLLT